MKLITYQNGGVDQLGIVQGDDVIAVADLAPGLPTTIKGLAALPDAVKQLHDALAARADTPRVPFHSVKLRPIVPDPGKIICVGLNYADHAAEGGHDIPSYPALFMRGANSLAAHGEALIRPQCSDKLDYEAELMIIIGRGGRHIKQADALDAVFAYTVFNDGSIRDYQRKSAQWTAGKNFDQTGPLGPWAVTPDELPPGASGLRIESRLNGQVMQKLQHRSADFFCGADYRDCFRVLDAIARRFNRDRYTRRRRLAAQAAGVHEVWRRHRD